MGSRLGLPPTKRVSYVCPNCGANLIGSEHATSCTRCKNRFPVLHGVPLLLSGIGLITGPSPDPEFVSEISQIAVPPAQALAHDVMRDLFATKFSFPDPQLGFEGDRFLHRLRSSGFTVRHPDGRFAQPQEHACPPHDAAARPGTIKLHRVTAPSVVLAGQEFWVQVRITNDGGSVLHATGPAAVRLSATAVRPFSLAKLRANRSGGTLTTPLLIDLQPGQAVTQAVYVPPQARPGALRCDIAVLTQADATLAGTSVKITVEAVSATSTDPLAVDWPYSEVIRDYHDDHQRAVSLLTGWLRDRLGHQDNPCVLELGGNAAPMLCLPEFDFLGHDCFNVDIDPFGLVFGTLQRRYSGARPVQDLLADGCRLPFADRSLDAVIMFATLHHFPDPVALLRHLATKLTRHGLICVLCEPVGHVTHGAIPAPFEQELRSGICEQAFEPWEWRGLFEAAGLRVAHAVHDRGSLKAALECAG